MNCFPSVELKAICLPQLPALRVHADHINALFMCPHIREDNSRAPLLAPSNPFAIPLLSRLNVPRASDPDPPSERVGLPIRGEPSYDFYYCPHFSNGKEAWQRAVISLS